MFLTIALSLSASDSLDCHTIMSQCMYGLLLELYSIIHVTVQTKVKSLLDGDFDPEDPLIAVILLV